MLRSENTFHSPVNISSKTSACPPDVYSCNRYLDKKHGKKKVGVAEHMCLLLKGVYNGYTDMVKCKAGKLLKPKGF